MDVFSKEIGSQLCLQHLGLCFLVHLYFKTFYRSAFLLTQIQREEAAVQALPVIVLK